MEYLERLDAVSTAFLRDLESADPVAVCGSIRWTTAELAAHLGAVHRWAALNARESKRHPRRNVPTLEMSPVEWYRESRDILLTALRELDPDARAYTLSKVDKSVRFWHRRQLFETLVHLWDLRSAADASAPAPDEVPPHVHADGVSELFDVFLPRSGTLAPLGGVVRLEATDTGERWVFGNDWQRDDLTEPTATVTGTAGEVLLYVWNRAERVERWGDLDTLRRFEKAHLRP